MRSGDYKLVLNGRLVEGGEKRADVFLSNVVNDPGERVDLAESMPALASELKRRALAWRQGIEDRWDREFAANYKSLT